MAEKCSYSLSLQKALFGTNVGSILMVLTLNKRNGHYPTTHRPTVSQTQLSVFCCLYLVFFYLFPDTSLLLMAVHPSWLFVKVISERKVNNRRESHLHYRETGMRLRKYESSLFPKQGLDSCFKRGVSPLLIFLSGQGLGKSKHKNKGIHQ